MVDAVSGGVSTMASTTQAYSDDEYKQILIETGYSRIEFHPSLNGTQVGSKDLFAIVARI